MTRKVHSRPVKIGQNTVTISAEVRDGLMPVEYAAAQDWLDKAAKVLEERVTIKEDEMMNALACGFGVFVVGGKDR